MDTPVIIVLGVVAVIVVIVIAVVIGLAVDHAALRAHDAHSDELVRTVRLDDIARAHSLSRTQFLWGVATAAFQNEGNTPPGTWRQWSRLRCPEGSDWMCGAWSFFEHADVPHAQWMGCNAFRFSLSWARVMPTPTTINDAALQRYVRMVDACIAAGMEPNVTLLHFDLPAWAPPRGWADPAAERVMLPAFARFARAAATAMQGRVRWWTTVNEPVIDAINCYLRGERWPGLRDIGATMLAIRRVWMAHNCAWAALKAVDPDCQVSVAKNVAVFRPRTVGSPIDHVVCRAFDAFYNFAFLDGCVSGTLKLGLGVGPSVTETGPAGTLDYIGVNHYNMAFAGVTGDFGVAVDMADGGGAGATHPVMGWEMRPSSMFRALSSLWARYAPLPLVITEAGCPGSEALVDDDRCEHMLHVVFCIQNAIMAGADVRGLFWWTLHDNLEWELRVPFGLWHTDFAAVRAAAIRNDPALIGAAFTPRASAGLYRDIIAAFDEEDEDDGVSVSGLSMAGSVASTLSLPRSFAAHRAGVAESLKRT